MGLMDWIEKAKHIFSSGAGGDAKSVHEFLKQLPETLTRDQFESFHSWAGKFLESKFSISLPAQTKSAIVAELDRTKSMTAHEGWQSVKSLLTHPDHISHIGAPILAFANEHKEAMPEWIAKLIP